MDIYWHAYTYLVLSSTIVRFAKHRENPLVIFLAKQKYGMQCLPNDAKVQEMDL
jgi:hypothetical protein